MSEREDEIFKEAAAALPLVPYDESLTASIMQQVQPAQVRQPSIDWRSSLLMLLSFTAFVGFFPLDSGDSAWSIASWAIALALLLILQPLLAVQSTTNGARSYA